MIDEPFAHGSTIIHRIDPRFKIVSAVLLSVVTAVSYRFQTLLCALMISLLLVVAARLNFKAVIKRLAVVFGFLVLIWAILPVTFEGEPFSRIGPLTVTRPGIFLSAQITLKSLSILMMFIALVTTASFAALGHAMDRLRIPSKIVHLLLMCYRYIFVMEQEYQRLMRAAKIRGFRPATSMHTYKTYAYFIGMLFVRAAARAERVYQAMKCRGFKGNFYCLYDFSSGWQNWVFAAIMTVPLITLIYLEIKSSV